MAAAKGFPLKLPQEALEKQPHPNDMVFLTLPIELYQYLTAEAGKRQMGLAQFLSAAVSEYLKKSVP